MSQYSPEQVLTILETLKQLGEIQKITTAFMPNFLNKGIYGVKQKPIDPVIADSDIIYWLCGSFNLGGTKSGRLSSSAPNLQQLPSTGSPYAKSIKNLVRAPKGWLFVGADYIGLESIISALKTRDPNKLSPYLEGYDDHCLRTYTYWKDKMPDIEPTVESINSIKEKYPQLRQNSKTVSFALLFGGTYKTLMENCNFNRKEAEALEKAYHKLYAESDRWNYKHLIQASEKGYVELAYKTRLRTPILAQSVITSERHLSKNAHKEIKTTLNALIQSYSLLCTKSFSRFMEKVWKSEFRLKIFPVAQIHDALYFVIEDTLNTLKYTNNELIAAMTDITGLPELEHETIKVGANLELYYPTWANPISLPNNASQEELQQTISNARKKMDIAYND